MAYYDVTLDFSNVQADSEEEAILRVLEQIQRKYAKTIIGEVVEQGTGDDTQTLIVQYDDRGENPEVDYPRDMCGCVLGTCDGTCQI